MESSDPAFVLLDRDSLLRELVRVVNERDAADHLVDVLVDERAALLVRLDFTLQLSEPAPGNLPRLASATPSPRGRGVLDSESSARAVPVGSDGLAGTAQGR